KRVGRQLETDVHADWPRGELRVDAHARIGICLIRPLQSLSEQRRTRVRLRQAEGDGNPGRARDVGQQVYLQRPRLIRVTASQVRHYLDKSAPGHAGGDAAQFPRFRLEARQEFSVAAPVDL